MTNSNTHYQAPASHQPQGKRLNLKCFNIGLGAVILSLSVFYLVNVSDLTVKGFALQELKTKVNLLASEKLDNEEKVNDLQSYYSLSTRTQKLNMVAVGEIDYLTVPSGVVARK